MVAVTAFKYAMETIKSSHLIHLKMNVKVNLLGAERYFRAKHCDPNIELLGATDFTGHIKI